MMRELPWSLFYALIVTIIVEGLVVLMMRRSAKWLYYSVLCNMLTNPLLNLSLIAVVWLCHADLTVYRVCVGAGEIIVVAAEFFIYRMITGERKELCFMVSLIANAASFLTGVILSAAGW